MMTNWMRPAGFVVALLWGGWWVFFALASGLAEKPGGWQAVWPTLIVAVIALGPVALAWRSGALGGALLVLEGLVFLGALVTGFLNPRPVSPLMFLLAALVLPPLLAGVLLLLESGKSGSFGAA